MMIAPPVEGGGAVPVPAAGPATATGNTNTLSVASPTSGNVNDPNQFFNKTAAQLASAQGAQSRVNAKVIANQANQGKKSSNVVNLQITNRAATPADKTLAIAKNTDT